MGPRFTALVRRLDGSDAMHYKCMTLNQIREGGAAVQDQVTVRLPAELNAALRRMARQLRRKNSDVVRMALEAYLQVGERTGRRPAERVGRLIGSLASGVPDLAERHREHIAGALRRGR